MYIELSRVSMRILMYVLAMASAMLRAITTKQDVKRPGGGIQTRSIEHANA